MHHLPESFSSAGVTDRKNKRGGGRGGKRKREEWKEEEEGGKDGVKRTEEGEGAGERGAREKGLA